MLGKHNRSSAASATLDARSRSDATRSLSRLASFAKRIQQRKHPETPLLPPTAASEDDVEVTVDAPRVPSSTRKQDFVNKLRQLARAHVVEAERSRSLKPAVDTAETGDESTAATENTSDDNVIPEEKKTGNKKMVSSHTIKPTKNNEPEGKEEPSRPFRPFKEIFEWTEWTRCGPCAMSWTPQGKNSGGGGLGASPFTSQDKTSAEQIRLYQHSMLEQQITPEDIDEIYAPPVHFDMDKRVTSISVPSLPHHQEEDEEQTTSPRSGDMSIGTRWTMSYATGATTEDYTRSYAPSGADSSTSYASSLYSSFASEPVHFDDSTTITTNY